MKKDVETKTAEDEKQKQGKPWQNVAYCDSFEEADHKRKSLEEADLDSIFEVKVKKLSDRFVVKTRSTEIKTKSKNK